jgi:hypothetical protein
MISSKSPRVPIIADFENRTTNVSSVRRQESFDVKAIDRLAAVEAERATDRGESANHAEPHPTPGTTT